MKTGILYLLLFILPLDHSIGQGVPGTTASNAVVYGKVTITDPGKIVTDLYTMVTHLRDSIYRQSSINKDEVIFNALPDSWEGKMKDVKNQANWPSIQKYTAWRIVATSEYDVLQIKADENSSMPEGFKPTKDFYIVIQKGGIESYRNKTASNETGNYCLLAAAMYEADKTKFESVKGKPLEARVGTAYEANMQKFGAEKIYIKDFFGSRYLNADLGYYSSLSKAVEQLSATAQKLRSCNSLTVKERKDKENTYVIEVKDEYNLFTIDLKIENEKDQYIVMLSLFHF
jgi:hypothetical protein